MEKSLHYYNYIVKLGKDSYIKGKALGITRQIVNIQVN